MLNIDTIHYINRTTIFAKILDAMYNKNSLLAKDMRINQLKYCNHEYEWKLESLVLTNLNLLVGASGVGKTQILEAIMNLQKISKGASLNGVEWEVKFTINNNCYHWEGEFEKQEISLLLEEIEKTKKKDTKFFKKLSIVMEKQSLGED
jgi:recombinational DNA repair ATPase RecF